MQLVNDQIVSAYMRDYYFGVWWLDFDNTIADPDKARDFLAFIAAQFYGQAW